MTILNDLSASFSPYHPACELHAINKKDYQSAITDLVKKPENKTYIVDKQGVVRVATTLTRVWETFKGFIGFENHCDPIKVNYELLKMLRYGETHKFLDDGDIKNLVKDLSKNLQKDKTDDHTIVTTAINTIFLESSVSSASSPAPLASRVAAIDKAIDEYYQKTDTHAHLEVGFGTKFWHRNFEEEDTDEIFNKGLFFAANNEYTEALHDMELALGKEPADADRLLGYAKTLHTYIDKLCKDNKTEEAKDLWDKCKSRFNQTLDSPLVQDIKNEMADCYMYNCAISLKEGNIDDAVKSFSEGETRKPNLLTEFDTLIKKQDLNIAPSAEQKNKFYSALAIAKQQKGADTAAVLQLIDRSAAIKALEDLKTNAKDNKAKAKFSADIGNIYKDQGKLTEAFNSYEEACTNDTQYNNEIKTVALSLTKEKVTDNSIKMGCLKTALKYNLKDDELLLAYAKIVANEMKSLFDKGNQAEAAKLWTDSKGYFETPSDNIKNEIASCFKYHCSILLKEGKVQEAIDSLTQGEKLNKNLLADFQQLTEEVKLDKNYKEFYLELAKTKGKEHFEFIKAKDQDFAIEVLQKVKANNTNKKTQADLSSDIGKLYSDLNRPTEAFNAFAEACQLNLEQTYLQDLKEKAIELKDSKDGFGHLEKALSYSPTDNDLLQNYAAKVTTEIKSLIAQKKMEEASNLWVKSKATIDINNPSQNLQKEIAAGYQYQCGILINQGKADEAVTAFMQGEKHNRSILTDLDRLIRNETNLVASKDQRNSFYSALAKSQFRGGDGGFPEALISLLKPKDPNFTIKVLEDLKGTTNQKEIKTKCSAEIGGLYLQEDNKIKAFEAFEEASNQDKQIYGPKLKTLALDLAKTSKPEDNIKYLDRALKHNAKDSDLTLKLAESHFKTNNTDKTIALCQEMPENATANFLLVDAYVEKGSMKEAAQSAQVALKKSPQEMKKLNQNPEFQKELVKSYAKQGDIEQVEKLSEATPNIMEDHAVKESVTSGYINKSVQAIVQNNPADAVKSLKKAEKSNGQNQLEALVTKCSKNEPKPTDAQMGAFYFELAKGNGGDELLKKGIEHFEKVEKGNDQLKQYGKDCIDACLTFSKGISTKENLLYINKALDFIETKELPLEEKQMEIADSIAESVSKNVDSLKKEDQEDMIPILIHLQEGNEFTHEQLGKFCGDLANIYQSQKEPEKAVEQFRKAKEFDDENDSYKKSFYDLSHQIGNSALKSGDSEKAIEFLNPLYEEGLNKDTKEEILFTLTQASANTKNWKNVISYSDDLLNNNSNHLEGKLLRCKAYLEQKNLLNATKEAMEIIQNNDKDLAKLPQSESLLQNMVKSYLNDNNTQKAELVLNHLSTNVAKTDSFLNNIAAEYLSKGKLESTEFVLQHMLNNDNQPEEKFLNHLADKYITLAGTEGQFLKIKDAETTIKLIEKNGYNSESTHGKIADFYNKKSKFQAAINHYEKGESLGGDYRAKIAGNYLLLGITKKENSPSEAIDCFEKSLEIATTEKKEFAVKKLKEYGNQLLENGDIENACRAQYLTISYCNEEEMIELLPTLAQNFENIEDTEKAIEIHQIMIDKGMSAGVTYTALGRLYAKAEKFEQAIESYTKAEKLEKKSFQPEILDCTIKLGDEKLEGLEGKDVAKAYDIYKQAYYLAGDEERDPIIPKLFECGKQLLQSDKQKGLEAYEFVSKNINKAKATPEEIETLYLELSKASRETDEEKALELLLEGKISAPRSEKILNELAKRYAELHNVEDALTNLEELEGLPNAKNTITITYMTIASTFKKDGKLDEALTLYEKVHKQNPQIGLAEIKDCLHQISNRYIEQGRYADALPYCQKILNNAVNEEDLKGAIKTLIDLGNQLQKFGREDLAKEAYEGAIKKLSDKIQIDSQVTDPAYKFLVQIAIQKNDHELANQYSSKIASKLYIEFQFAIADSKDATSLIENNKLYNSKLLQEGEKKYKQGIFDPQKWHREVSDFFFKEMPYELKRVLGGNGWFNKGPIYESLKNTIQLTNESPSLERIKNEISHFVVTIKNAYSGEKGQLSPGQMSESLREWLDELSRHSAEIDLYRSLAFEKIQEIHSLMEEDSLKELIGKLNEIDLGDQKQIDTLIYYLENNNYQTEKEEYSNLVKELKELLSPQIWYHQALKEFDRICPNLPTFNECHNQWIDTYYKLGDFEKAVSTFLELRKKFPSAPVKIDTDILLNLDTVSDSLKASFLIQNAQDLEKNDEFIYAAHDFITAAGCCEDEKELKLISGSLISLGEKLFKGGDNYNAILSFETALSLHESKKVRLDDEQLAIIYSYLISAKKQRGQLDSAINDCMNALKDSNISRSRRAEIHFDLAEIYSKQHLTKDALEHYSKAYELHRNSSKIRAGLIQAEVLYGNTIERNARSNDDLDKAVMQEAISHYQKACDLSPNVFGEQYNELIAAHVAIGEYDKAISLYNQFKAKFPDQKLDINNSIPADAYVQLAHEQVGQSKLLPALLIINNALKISPKNQVLLDEQSKIYRLIGRDHLFTKNNYKNAYEIFQKALTCGGRSEAQTYADLGNLFYMGYTNWIDPETGKQITDIDQSKKMLEKAIEYFETPVTDFGRIPDLVGEHHFQLGKLHIEHIQRYAGTTSGQGEALNAWLHLKEAVRINPDNKAYAYGLIKATSLLEQKLINGGEADFNAYKTDDRLMYALKDISFEDIKSHKLSLDARHNLEVLGGDYIDGATDFGWNEAYDKYNDNLSQFEENEKAKYAKKVVTPKPKTPAPAAPTKVITPAKEKVKTPAVAKEKVKAKEEIEKEAEEFSLEMPTASKMEPKPKEPEQVSQKTKPEGKTKISAS